MYRLVENVIALKGGMKLQSVCRNVFLWQAGAW